MDLTLFAMFFVACVAAGATGALFPTGEWYKSLQKPTWVPPNWVFPVAWTSIYLLMSFAGARVAVLDGAGVALAFWALQIAFNTLWTPVFFGLRHWKGSLFAMTGLWISVAGFTVTGFQLDTWAGIAFLPYLLWVTVAAALNISIVRLNPDQKPLEIHKI